MRFGARSSTVISEDENEPTVVQQEHEDRICARGRRQLGCHSGRQLRELVAYGIRPDFVVGSAVGAVNGAYFAGDPTAKGIARLVDESGLRRLIERHLQYRTPEEATIPLHIAATELLSGASVPLPSGSAAEAILASCAIPVAFPPVRYWKRLSHRRAIASNTPLMSAVELGAERLIVLQWLQSGGLTRASAFPMRSGLVTTDTLHELARSQLCCVPRRQHRVPKQGLLSNRCMHHYRGWP